MRDFWEAVSEMYREGWIDAEFKSRAHDLKRRGAGPGDSEFEKLRRELQERREWAVAINTGSFNESIHGPHYNSRSEQFLTLLTVDAQRSVIAFRQRASAVPSDEDVLNFSWARFGRHPSQVFSRADVREKVGCRECLAVPGEHCIGKGGYRDANHAGRCFDRVRLLMLNEPKASGF